MPTGRRRQSHPADERVAALAPMLDADLSDSPDDEPSVALFRAITSDAHRSNGKGGTPIFDIAPRRPGRLLTMVAAAVIGVAILAATLLTTLGAAPGAGAAVTLQSLRGVPLQGGIPSDAISHGLVDWAKVPPFVSTVWHGTVVGYVRKSDLRHPARLVGPLQGPIPKCGTDGVNVYNAHRVLVGHVYPEVGYTPLGVAPSCPPPSGAPGAPPPGISSTHPGGPGSGRYSPGVAVPRVLGKSLGQAEQTLRNAGFSVKVVSIASPGAAPGTVVAEAPIPGAPMTPGSEVTVSVAS